MSEAEGSGLYDAEYSDSDSDDESETGLSEESDSDSSDGSGSEEEEDDDESVTEESRIVEVQGASGISSDEGGEKESCPICLNRFIGQDLGIPESCEHIFCLECIREWSKNINTCPIDRTEFNHVHLKSTPDGKILKKIKVKVRPKEPEDALQQEVTVCEVCRHGDREDRLLLCDACDLAYHCECLDPPLFHVPIDEWFCPPCRTVLQNGAVAVAGPSAPRSRRVIPRTRASENVRTRVQDRRTRPTIPRTPSTVRKRAPQKRKRRAYRRSYKKVVTLARTKKNLMDGSKGKECPRSTAVIVTYRRRRRRRKKRRVTTKASSGRKSSSRSVTKRISKNLGLVKSSQGGSIPDVKAKNKSSSGSVRPSGSSHFLFGDKNQLMDFSESFHEDVPGPSRRQQETSQQSSSSSINILDTIMAGQTILHTKSNNVIIKTDGSLVLKENKTKEKATFKKPAVSEETSKKEATRKSNVCDRMSEAGTIKKSNVCDKTKDKGKGIIKKPDASSKGKSGRVTFGEPSALRAIPKTEKHSENKPSPMLLAALARRRENEKSNSSDGRSPIERTLTSSDNLHSSLLYQSDQNMDVQTDNLHNRREFIDYQSSSGTKLNTSPIKHETDDKTNIFKCESNEKRSRSSHSTHQSLNNVSRFHSALSEDSISLKNSRIKNENISTNSRVKKSDVQKYIKKEKNNDLLSEKSVVATSSSNATFGLSTKTEIDDENDDTMELPSSQSLIQSKPDNLLTSFSNVKQQIKGIKKEPHAFNEDSGSECSQNLVGLSHKQLRSESSHKSLSKKINPFKKSVKKLLESSDDECQSTDREHNNSFIESPRQVIDNVMSDDEDDTQDFEESQSIITQTLTETMTKNLHTNRKQLKEEINSSGDETNVHHASKVCSQSKPMNKSRNNKNVSEDFSKIKIKEELPSSEDEGGESCSLLTDALPCTQLAERSNLPYTHLKDSTYNCTQGRNTYFNEDVNDLPCTQLVETTCEKNDGSPFTHSSRSFNKSDDLPCTQPIESLGNFGDNLPCTQLLKSKSLKYQPNNEDDIPGTQPTSPSSNMEMDDLPCTQLLESSLERPVTNEEEYLLPCTQLAKMEPSMLNDDLPSTQFAVPAPVKCHDKKRKEILPATQSSSSFSKMPMNNLSCTQLVDSSSIEEDNALPCTQLARPLSGMQRNELSCNQLVASTSIRQPLKEEALPCTQPSSPTYEMEMNDLPSTQFAVPAPVKSISKKKEKTLPTTRPVKPSEIEMDDLPCTQLVQHSSKSVSNEEVETLPCTQLARPVSSLEMEDLPCTQLAGPVSGMDEEDFPCTQLARPLSDLQVTHLPGKQFAIPAVAKQPFKNEDALPCTQPSSPLSNMEMNDLPCTQFAVPAPVKSFSKKKGNELTTIQISRPLSEMPMDDLPCTQLLEPLSKSVFNEEDTLPCTQLAVHGSSLEMEDLPCTQLARPQSSIQMDNVPSTHFAVPTKVKISSKKKTDSLLSTQSTNHVTHMETDDLPCTQMAKLSSLSNKDNDILPCTQVATPVSSLHSGESSNDHPNNNIHLESKRLPTYNKELSCDNNAQTNLSNIQQNVIIEKSTNNSKNLNNSNLDDDFDLPETQPLTFDQEHSDSTKSLPEDSNSKHVTDEELLANIDKLKMKRPPPVKKVVGIHKNLPQVLMPIPSRRIPIPKPSNRKTFSFEQVKQPSDTRDDKNTFNESISHERKLFSPKNRDLLSKQTTSFVLKEQQVSSKCKAVNSKDFKEEKSTIPLFVDEPKISISVRNSDPKVQIDKNSTLADSEIEVIDNEMTLKKVEEVVLTSDEEDLPATQCVVRPSDHCSDVMNQGKFVKPHVSIKKEPNGCVETFSETQQCVAVKKTLDSCNVNRNVLEKVIKKEPQDSKTENRKNINALPVKKEKCEENILVKIKTEPLELPKTEEQVSRLKGKTKSHNLEDITDVRNIRRVDDCAKQKVSNSKVACNNNDSRYVKGHEKYVKENKSKTDISDLHKKTGKDRSSSSEEKLKFEKDKVNKNKSSPEKAIHSNTESMTKTKDTYLSKSSSNSKLKVKTESVNELKLVSKDKKLKTENVVSSHSHSKDEHVKNHRHSVEKRKSSLEKDNYCEDSKRQKLNKLNGSKQKQEHKVDAITIKQEPTTDKNRKQSCDKTFDVSKDTHKLKNNIKIEDTKRHELTKPPVKTDKMSNLGKTKETRISNNEKSRHNSKSANVHSKTIETKNSFKSSSDASLKVSRSGSPDKKRNIKNGISEKASKESRDTPCNNKEKLNGSIRSDYKSEKKVKNQLKESETNLKEESARRKRLDSIEDVRNSKRPCLERLSCNDDTSDCHSDYSRSSEISSESSYRKKSNHERNALNALNEIADEIISTSKTSIFKQDENVDLEVKKRSKDPSSLGRKVDKAHLKDEIAAEVKSALKPFYTIGLIDKEDYKDIMRKAVPKIFMNCGSYLNPEKIKNLVTSYVKRLTNS